MKVLLEQFPELHTSRLRLGQIKEKDLSNLVRYANNKNVVINTTNMPYPYLEEHGRFWMEMSEVGFMNGDQYVFGVFIRPQNDLIGNISLLIEKKHSKAELGYWLGEPFWNKGYGSEAVRCMIKFGIEVLGLNKIYGTHYLYNPASEKVMLRAGMEKEADFREHVFKNGRFEDLRQYCILEKDYFDRKE